MTIQIVSAEVFVVPIFFRMRFRHATAERDQNTTIFLRLVSSSGVEGWGETLTRPYLTGETPESVKAHIRIWWDEVKKLTFGDTSPRSLLVPLWRAASDSEATAAWSMIDVACYDLWMKSMTGNFSDVGIDAPKKRFAVSFPVGLGTNAILLKLGRALKFRHLKVKTRRDPEPAIRLIAKAGSGWTKVVIDGNGCFAGDDFRTVQELVNRTGVHYIEQPFAKGDLSSAARLVASKTTRVVADESLCTLEDAHMLIRDRAADVFNIRLAKVGGITGALEIAALARKNGIGVQLGSLVGETGLLCNAARSIMDELGPELYEYSFPKILLKDSPVRSDVPMIASELSGLMPRSAGFAAVRSDVLRHSAIEHVVL